MLSSLAQHNGENGKADRLLARSEALRQGLGDTVGVALCARDRGILASEQGRYTEAEAQYARCLRLIHAPHKPEIEAHVQALRGASCGIKDSSGQRTRFYPAVCASGRGESTPADRRLQRHLALLAFYEGRLPEAEKRLRDSVGGYRAVEDTYATAETQLWQARVLYHRGRTRDASALLQRCAPTLQQQGARLAVVRAWELRAECRQQARPTPPCPSWRGRKRSAPAWAVPCRPWSAPVRRICCRAAGRAERPASRRHSLTSPNQSRASPARAVNIVSCVLIRTRSAPPACSSSR